MNNQILALADLRESIARRLYEADSRSPRAWDSEHLDPAVRVHYRKRADAELAVVGPHVEALEAERDDLTVALRAAEGRATASEAQIKRVRADLTMLLAKYQGRSKWVGYEAPRREAWAEIETDLRTRVAALAPQPAATENPAVQPAEVGTDG